MFLLNRNQSIVMKYFKNCKKSKKHKNKMKMIITPIQIILPFLEILLFSV